MPAAARRVLAGYAHRIEQSVNHSAQGQESEAWTDPDSGRSRSLTNLGGRRIETGLVPAGAFTKTVFVMYGAKTWMSDRQPSFRHRATNEAALLAQAISGRGRAGAPAGPFPT